MSTTSPVESRPHGLLLIDKPAGPTSHDLVAAVRRELRIRRVGHTGTLDPMASGLLPLVLGRATRLARFLPQQPKVYVGRLRLGLTTTTDDVTGEVATRHRGVLPSPDEILAAARSLVGPQLQTPPRFSARKVGGQRLYRLARQGKPASAPARPVEVASFDVTPGSDPSEWCFMTRVSSGTYVRALVRDLGAKLQVGGVLAELRRTAIGSLDVTHALAFPVVGAPAAQTLVHRIIPLDDMPLQAPRVILTAEDEVLGFVSGEAATVESSLQGMHRVTDRAGRLLGMGQCSNGRLQPRVVVERR